MSFDVATCSRTAAKITSEEWFEISRALEPHHAVFYKVWEMGRPVFDDSIPTACVQFDSKGNFVWFRFNPEFWVSLDFYNKLFVICHEALHVVLNHGSRGQDSGVNQSAVNVAMDIVVNHSLVRNFGFEREKIARSADYCWIDTVFKDYDPKPANDETFEHYFNLFDTICLSGEGMPSTVDDHSRLGDGKKWGKVIDQLNKELTEDEKAELENIVKKHFHAPPAEDSVDTDACEGGSQSNSGSGQWVFIKTKQPKKKKKWETIIKNWALRRLKTTDKEVEQWLKINRRMSVLPRDMMLPSNAEEEVPDLESSRIMVWFFLDTSGSCWDLKDRFFTAAESMPENRFAIRLFCFDTTVQETTLASKKVYGGGGTSFKILEEHVQQLMTADGVRHPDAVFVITDGYGDKIKTSEPKRWHWFLTAGGAKNYIDKLCNIYSLADFE